MGKREKGDGGKGRVGREQRERERGAHEILHSLLTCFVDAFHVFKDVMRVAVDNRNAKIVIVLILKDRTSQAGACHKTKQRKEARGSEGYDAPSNSFRPARTSP